ncbi:ABC transporter permease [Sandaracinus amylolyticus]|uniref:ABC-transporter permease protein n=1 Tax=Sandaracinus amylolyticus TaxID=927083 RepID=A0A0F6SG05_9BACT|nr:ABC transporter permease [Sandaracinus amylolyticus]AKF07854.1 ABC-transporter permease protein [Sandaracinus amylolyticus]
MNDVIARPRRSAVRGRGGRLRLMALLAVRMMFHDRFKLVGTLLGVVFAVVLVNQQLGVLFALLDKNTMFVDHAGADVWILPPQTETLQGGAPIALSTLSLARTTAGAEWAEPLAFGTATVRRPDGGNEPVSLVGTRLPRLAGGPWNVVAGDPRDLADPDVVFFEDSQRTKLGGMNLRSVREMSGRRVVAGGFTWGLSPFAPPYAFAEHDTARDVLGIATDQTSFVLVGARDGVSPERLRDALAARLPDLRVVTAREFSTGIVAYLLAEQLGISFGTSTTFAVIVGFVIVALSMFSAVVDNVREFGTLKAMGCTTWDLASLLWAQSLLYAFLGTTFGLFLVTRMAEGMRSPQLSLVLPTWMWLGSYVGMAVLCVLASTLALVRVRNVEPGMVFR